MRKRYTLGTQCINGMHYMYDDGKLIDAGCSIDTIDQISDNCEIKGGWFHGGVFNGGEFLGGWFFDGEFNGGKFFFGYFYGGVFTGGAPQPGNYYGGVFYTTHTDLNITRREGNDYYG